jgi:hypothetical protein
MVVQDQSEVVCVRAQGQHGGMIDPWTTMHEYQWISLSDDLHKEGHAPNWNCCHELLSNKRRAKLRLAFLGKPNCSGLSILVSGLK